MEFASACKICFSHLQHWFSFQPNPSSITNQHVQGLHLNYRQLLLPLPFHSSGEVTQPDSFWPTHWTDKNPHWSFEPKYKLAHHHGIHLQGSNTYLFFPQVFLILITEVVTKATRHINSTEFKLIVNGGDANHFKITLILISVEW